jgi:hypothetical protein
MQEILVVATLSVTLGAIGGLNFLHACSDLLIVDKIDLVFTL